MTVVGQSEPMAFEIDSAGEAIFRELWGEYNTIHSGEPHDPMRVRMFQQLMVVANAAPAGDYIELGCHRGLTARLIWRLMDQTKALYLLDTFEGFVAEDLEAERLIRPHPWLPGSFLPTSPEEVWEYVAGTPADNRVAVKGWFPTSYFDAGLYQRRWLFAHIDFDLYAPIKAALEICWPQTVPGGVVAVHDCGCPAFPGARQATEEFASSIGLVPVPMCDAWGTAVLIKPTKQQ